MRRRDLLLWAAAVSNTLASRIAFGEGDAKERAAVVIGVNRAGNLPKLKAAVSGAEKFGNWLKTQDFDVKFFVDNNENDNIQGHDIFKAVSEFVDKGTIQLLVVYFAGHGFANAYSEYWLLSDAPSDPMAAINLYENCAAAKLSKIPNVVFISDACRSTSDSLGITRILGQVIFPTPQIRPRFESDVDQFLATGLGVPAWEARVSESVSDYQGVYTASFLGAFEHPNTDMVATVNGLHVVPNRRLKDYLASDVPKRAEAISIKLEQHPSTNVVSRDEIYIGRVADAAVAAATPAPPRVVTIEDVANDAIARAAGAASPIPNEQRARIDKLANATGFEDTANRIVLGPPPAHFETGTGISVSGARVIAVAAVPGMKALILHPGDSAEPALVRVYPESQRAGTVALQFADGSGTVIAALADFVAYVVVEKGGVSNISYIPALTSNRWQDYQYEHERLDQLRAAVAAAAKFGVFRVEKEDAAASLGNYIRVAKSIDPTLGVYAAYAYDQAGLLGQVRSVRLFMQQDLGADIFDVAMLSADPFVKVEKGPVVPFCPVLSQGWNLLRIKRIDLPPVVTEARFHLRPALWTTFDRDGMTTLMISNLWG
jgi:hypothetical protein